MIALLAAFGCAPRRTDYAAYLAHFPKSVLVLPPINESLEVRASGMFLSTITTQLAEKGYYVLPVSVVDALFKAEGVPLPPEMHQVSVEKLREIYGADAILYVTIKEWTTTYVVFNTTTTVVLQYRLIDTATEGELWRWAQAFQYSPSNQQNNIISMMLVSAVHAAESGSGRLERNVAAAANVTAINTPNHGLLTGPRHPRYVKDLEKTRQEQKKLEERRAKKGS
jgi:hypothetical protein